VKPYFDNAIIITNFGEGGNKA